MDESARRRASRPRRADTGGASPDRLTVEVGGVPVCLCTSDPTLLEVLTARFRRFLTASADPAFRFDITVIDPPLSNVDADLEVRESEGRWVMRRGDFRAEWDVSAGRGRIWQPLSPYGADTVLRIVHSLILSTQGGFLLHASSVIRNGRAFLFTGPSGAGKSTIVGLAPDDVVVLTDEICTSGEAATSISRSVRHLQASAATWASPAVPRWRRCFTSGGAPIMSTFVWMRARG